MVSPYERDSIRIANFEGKEQEECLDGEEASVYEVAYRMGMISGEAERRE